MASSSGFRPPKQWVLTEHDSITSYATWQSTMLYHLCLCNDCTPFHDTEWGKHGIVNRGLRSDGDDVAAASHKTAVQKKIVLE